jgi:hypothetical protein
MMTAWQNESSVRHVGSDGPGAGGVTPPTLPYVQGRPSQDSSGSPNRSMRRGEWDKQRAVGMA